MLIGLFLWSGLTLLFLWRFKVILLNCRTIIRPARRWYRLPMLNGRPLKQLAIWVVELFLLCFFYLAFGTSALSHMTAAVVSAGLMLMLRERKEPNFLRSLQILPLVEARTSKFAA